MIPAPVLLRSIKCGTCKSSLVKCFKENGVLIYKCKCLLKTRTLLVCTYCKKQFLNFPYLVRKTNYCSLNCYWTGTDKRQLKQCKSCGKEFYADAISIRKGFGFYCSQDCWFKLFSEKRREVECRQCGKTFRVIEAVYKKKPKYCSKVCKDESEKDPIEMICKGCNRTFIIQRSGLSRGRGLFCTWSCFKKYRGESSLELIVRQRLEELKEPFQQEMRIGKFRMDFYLPKRNLVIECDGEYWHMSLKNKLRDKRKDKLLLECGYNILRLRGQDIVTRNFTLIFEAILTPAHKSESN